MISVRAGTKKESIKKADQQKIQKRKYPFYKKSTLSSQTNEFKIFQSTAKESMKSKIDSQSNSKYEQAKISNKIFTTDESNNEYQPKTHQSIYITNRKQPQNEYFQQPLSDYPQKMKGLSGKKQQKINRIQYASIKIQQMKQLVKYQNQQLSNFKNTLSTKEIQRLVKIHSIQKLKFLQSISVVKSKKGSKNVK